MPGPHCVNKLVKPCFRSRMIKQSRQTIMLAGTLHFTMTLYFGLDHRRQKHRIERLVDELIAAQTQRRNLHFHIGFGGKIDHRQRLTGGQLTQYAGRFDERQKNITKMVTAFVQVAQRLPVVVVLCGDGPDRNNAERQVSEAGMSKQFIFTGHSASVWAWMKKAKAFVCVGEFEGQPNTVMEAMACECPLVLSDIPGHRALVDHTMAQFVDANDPLAIADGITRVLNRETLARERAEKAKRRSQAFSMDKMAFAYEAVYRECSTSVEVEA